MAPFEIIWHNLIDTLSTKTGGEGLWTEKSKILHLPEFAFEPAVVFINYQKASNI